MARLSNESAPKAPPVGGESAVAGRAGLQAGSPDRGPPGPPEPAEGARAEGGSAGPRPGSGEADTAPPGSRQLAEVVDAKAQRKLAARARSRPLWYGLGMFGLVGWAVALPTLAGLAIGRALDQAAPRAGHSWTLALLLAGVVLGCANAWYWVSRESRRQ